jgi:bacillithiol biosynthesis deacetylase BshB1
MQNQKINLLAFAAHPDDVEISISGIMLKHAQLGLKTGIVDLTEGELGTRGSSELRYQESQKSSEILGLTVRENLNLGDGFFEINQETLLKVIVAIRKYQADIILINAESDRHPDHGRAHDLLKRACFLSGLVKINTLFDGVEQLPWRPKQVYSYIQDYYLEPDVVIDVSEFWKLRMNALMAYSSQFYDPNSTEPKTPISGPDFLNHIEARAVQFGRFIHVAKGEGLRKVRPIGVNNLNDLI